MALRAAGPIKRIPAKDTRQRLVEVPPPPLPFPDLDVQSAAPVARSHANPLELHHFQPGQLLTSDDLNRFVDALLALDERLAAIEAKLEMPVKS
jgi:hypothetical protein